MPQRLKVNGPSTPDEIAAARKSYQNSHDQERLIALQMAQQGRWRIADIARALSKGTATISRWLQKYRQGGIQKLLHRGHGARQPKLHQDDLEALKEGLRQCQWKTIKEIQQWLSQRGKKLSLSGVYYWLMKVNASLRVPRKKHYQQDEKEVQAFKDNVVDKLNDLSIPKNRRVRIWIEDEHRYGLISTIRRCWTLRGHRPEAYIQMKYQWGYVYGAAEVTEGDAEFLYLPTVSLE